MKTLLAPVALVAALTAIIQIAPASAFGDEPRAGSFLRNGVTAHRGDSSEHPENTLPAFQSGIEIGADWIELDVLRTSDGKLVVIHDETTGRVGDKNLQVGASTYEQLLTVDVATEFRQRHGRSLEAVPRHSVPLLADVLRLVMAQSKTRVSIQPKVDCVAETIALVKELRAERWVGYNDGNLQFMAEVKRLAPSIPVFWDRGASDVDADLRIAKQHGFESLVLHHSTVTREKINKIHAAGLAAGVWTVNDEATMVHMLNLGVERIYTDTPQRLLRLKKTVGLRPTACQGIYPHHLQGICTNARDAFYWSFTTTLVKTNRDGTVLKKVAVANHHGDLCYDDQKIYVAVNLGEFNEPAGQADSWVYVYDAQDLALVGKHKLPQVVHGAGGMDCLDGRFYLVGGLPVGVPENYVYEYDRAFHFVRRHVIPSGNTLMGIQTAAFAHGHWWFGCYGAPPVLLKTDPSFRLLGTTEFDGSLGIAGLPDARLLVARGSSRPGIGCTGRIVLAHADAKTGAPVEGDRAEKAKD